MADGSTLVLAFTAGLVATVNPCGFAMLPAYLSYFLGLGEDVEAGRPAAVGRALTVGGVVSVGLLVVFGVVGTVFTLGFRSVVGVLPWAALVVGAGVGLLGLAMLAGLKPSTRLPTPRQGVSGRGYGSVLVFGGSYAVASLSCTLPVFLGIVGLATAASPASGLMTFLAYGLGMSLLLTAATVAVGLSKQSLLARLRRSGRYLDRVAGGILVLAGAYIVWYWAANLSGGVGAGGAPTTLTTLSGQATRLLGEHATLVGLGLAVVLLAAAGYAASRQRQPGEPGPRGAGTRDAGDRQARPGEPGPREAGGDAETQSIGD